MSSDESLAAADAGGEEPQEEIAPAPVVVENSTYANAQGAAPRRPGLDMKKIIGLHEIQGGGIIRKALAEFTGTFLLVFIACGACMKTRSTSAVGVGSINAVTVSLVFGFTVATIVQTLGHVSGGHLNPAVSFGLIPAGHCGLARAGIYLVAQCLGSTVAAFLLYIAVPWSESGGLGTTQIQADLADITTGKVEFFSLVQGLIIEFIITFVLVLLVCGVLDKLRNKDVKGYAPLAVGLAIAAGHFLGFRFTGPSMNPARSFGPALVYAIMGPVYEFVPSTESQPKLVPLLQLWVYFVGPIAGGLVAGVLYRVLFKERETFDNDEELRAEAEQQNPAQTSKA